MSKIYTLHNEFRSTHFSGSVDLGLKILNTGSLEYTTLFDS